MKNYYLLENEIITQTANFKFDENCLETQEEIVRDELSGQLYLRSDYESLILTDEYNVKVGEAQKTIKIVGLQSQIDELDKKSIRALREGGIKDSTTGQSWLEYYTEQILDLRARISVL